MADQEAQLKAQLEALRAAGRAVVDAETARQVAVRKAVEAGVPITSVARELGLSRPTIYKMLEGPI